MNMLENIQVNKSLKYFKIISSKFPRAEIKLFQTDIDEGRHNLEIILFHM